MTNTANGYTYPEPTAPVKNGAVDIKTLALQVQPLTTLFSGQTPLAGSTPAAGLNYQVYAVVYNYAAPTNSQGYLAIPLPFATCVMSAYVMLTDPAVDAGILQIAKSLTTKSSLSVLVRKRTDHTAGLISTNVPISMIAWGYLMGYDAPADADRFAVADAMTRAATALGWRPVLAETTPYRVVLTVLPPLARSTPARDRWPGEPREGPEHGAQ